MSLINQVLRDLDSRHAAVEQRSLPNEVRPLPSAGERRPGMAVPAGIAVLALVAAAVWATWEPAADPVPPAAVAPSLPLSAAAPPPPLVIAPPALPASFPAMAEAALPNTEQVASVQQSLRMSADLTPPSASARVEAAAPVVATTVAAASSIDKQVRVGGHERAEAAYRKAAVERHQGRDTEAMALLREALQRDPAHGNARQLLLSLLVERKLWPEAEAALREGLELAPAHSPWAVALARIQVERGQPAQAWETLLRFMSAGEHNADYLGFAGVLLQRLQRPAEAIGYYEAALRLRPEARWWIGLGVALEGSNRAGEAREAFQRAQVSSGLTPEMTALIDHRLSAGKP